MKRCKFLILVALFSMFIYIPEVDAMRIFVKKMDGENISLDVESTDTIEAVKNKIYVEDNSFLPQNQKLIFAGNILEDGRILSDYNIINESTIFILLNNNIVKVTFDGNGGTFGNDSTYVIDDWKPELYDTLKVPVRDGYKFKGFFTEKTGGVKFEMILNEAGIDNNSVFYAQWEEIDLEEMINPSTECDGNNAVIMLMVSFLGLLIVLKFYEKKKIKL